MIVLRKNRYVKDDNLHRYHIRQGVAEDPGLMHRVKKVAFRTRLQSVMSPRVYNHHFFTRNNSCLDLKRQCRTKVDERESGMSPTVLPQFPSTGPTLMPCPRWYTRSAFPVPAASFCPFGTPEARKAQNGRNSHLTIAHRYTPQLLDKILRNFSAPEQRLSNVEKISCINR